MASTRPTFVHLETVRGLHARGHAHSARASESTGAICKAGCRPWVSGHTDAYTHIGMASTRPTFVHSETVRGLHARDRAHSARASESTGAIWLAGCRPWVSDLSDARTHLCARGVRDRLLSTQKRCGGCMPVAAHTRQERRGALARSDRLTADLGSPDTPMLAHTLAWRRHDRFRPSRFLTNSPCHQGRYPSALGGRYRPYGRSSLSVKVCACRNF